MTAKIIAYIVVDLLFLCVLVAAAIHSRRERRTDKDKNAEGGRE